MRHIGPTILLLLAATISRAQHADFDFKQLEFRGLGFMVTKQEIIERHGAGKRVEPNYECGFFTNDQKTGPFYQLVYEGFNYIGSDKEEFFYLEAVDFDTEGNTKLRYQDKVLSGLTTEAEFMRIFGEHVRKHEDQNAFWLFAERTEDWGVFFFKNGRLVKFEYRTPC